MYVQFTLVQIPNIGPKTVNTSVTEMRSLSWVLQSIVIDQTLHYSMHLVNDSEDYSVTMYCCETKLQNSLGGHTYLLRI